MINTNALRGAMISAGYPDIKSAAESIGMNTMTMYRKLKKRVFDSDEIYVMLRTYNIPKEQAMEIFFADKVN